LLKGKTVTSKERERRSRARQALGAELKVWEQKIKDMETAVLLRVPGAAERLAFCRQEHKKCTEAMWLINKGVERQQAWVSGSKQ
jgi:hypothetical protein